MPTSSTNTWPAPTPSTKPDLQGADQLLVRWRQANDRINSYISVGNYRAATQVALGKGEDDSTPAFDKLDEALTKGHGAEPHPPRTDVSNATEGWPAPGGRRGAQPERRHRRCPRAVAQAEGVSVMARLPGPDGCAGARRSDPVGRVQPVPKPLKVVTVPTLPLPHRSACQQMPIEPHWPPDTSSQDCNPHRQPGPFPNKAEADAAVAASAAAAG